MTIRELVKKTIKQKNYDGLKSPWWECKCAGDGDCERPSLDCEFFKEGQNED